MRYMLLLCDIDTTMGPSDLAVHPDHKAWRVETDGRGIKHRGVRLRPASEAVTVRVRNGEVLVSDGPYAETKEQVGGFEIIELDDLDHAIERAGAHPAASGFVEIRPFPEED